MEDRRSKRISDGSREKNGSSYKKQSFQEKKTKSDTTTFSSGSSLTDASLESIVVIGKSCNFIKSKSHDSGYHLHECHSEISIFPVPGKESVPHYIPGEGGECIVPLSNLSNTSFISAKSDVSSGNPLTNKINDIENEINKNNVPKQNLKKLALQPQHSTIFKSDSNEIDTVINLEEYLSKLKDLEKKIEIKEKKILDLNHKFHECILAKNMLTEENKGLTHSVSFLNRQLQSMYELIKEKKWNSSLDITEFMKYKNKNVELEVVVAKQQNEKQEISKQLERALANLELKEQEVNLKNKELLDCRNRNALEINKLINQIDYLKGNMNTQSQFFDEKINDAQNSMDDEIVKITTKLEEQYQKDLKLAIEKLQSDFETLSALPSDILEKLLQISDWSNIDFVFEKNKERQQLFLENKIMSIQANYDKEIMYLKDSYETKLIFLKTQVESLSSQLQERKEIIDVFESELMAYKSSSAMNLLRASSIANDVTSLKELYAAEIFSQKQIHKLEMDVFEEKVKNLSEEILYRAKNEEIRSQELDSAKKMALIYREKYEHLVFEWEERVERDFKINFTDRTDKLALDNMFNEFNDLINSLKEAEKVHEEKIKNLQLFHQDEIASYKRDIEIFKTKISQLEVFQKAQSKLDSTIQDLIKSVGSNYIKTVDALVTSHVAEQSLKDLEIYTFKKKHGDEIQSVKNEYQKEVKDLQNKLQIMEKSKAVLQKEINSLRKNCGCEELKSLQNKFEEISVKLLKCEGVIAAKEEAEKILNERIKDLEGKMQLKEENCRKELEGLIAKLIEVNILSSAKNDLAAELEEKLNESEKRLEKSNHNMSQLFEICSLVDENLKKVDVNIPVICDFKKNAKYVVNYASVQRKNDDLNLKFLPNYDEINFLEKEKNWSKEKEKILELSTKGEFDERNKKLAANLYLLIEEKNKAVEKAKKLKKENSILLEKLAEKDQIIVNNEKEKYNVTQINEKISHLNDKQMIQKELETLKTEKKALLAREEALTIQINEIIQQNKTLEKDVEDLHKNVEILKTEIKNYKENEEDATFSISLQEVRVFYEEEENIPEMQRCVSLISIGCQIELLNDINYEDLVEENKKLKEQDKSKSLEVEYQQKILANYNKELYDITQQRNHCIANSEKLEIEVKTLQDKNGGLLIEVQKLKEEKNTLIKELELLKKKNYDIESNIEKVEKEKISLVKEVESFQKKICDMNNESEELISDKEKLKNENNNLKEKIECLKEENYELQKLRSNAEILGYEKSSLIKEIESLKDENYAIETSYEAKLKITEHKVSSSKEENALQEIKINEMKKEIDKLNELIKNLSAKLKILNTSNENLVNEKNTHLRHNQSLTKELEDAWTQRFEIEDQLAKVRRENVFLNIYRTQLEETNKKISNLLAEGKTSAVSWAKIHETVENIMDEMLTLKTSLRESLTPINIPVECDTPKKTTELKLMTENLQTQLINKTLLCDELAVQNKTIENELKDLEELLKQNDSRILKQWRLGEESYDIIKNKKDDYTNQPVVHVVEKSSKISLDTIQENEKMMEKESEEKYLIKTALEKNNDLEKNLFEETLELKKSGTKMERLEDVISEKTIKETENVVNFPAKVQYKKEQKATVQLEDIVNSTKPDNNEGADEELTKKYIDEMEKLSLQLETSQINFEKTYKDLYKKFETKISQALQKELKEITISFFKKLKEEKDDEHKLFILENFVEDILNKFVQEVIFLQNNYKLVFNEFKSKYSVDLENIQVVINKLRNNFKKIKEDILEQKSCLENTKSEYESKLKMEKKKLCDILEEIKQQHKKEILEVEDFWTDKLSECETKCALMKAMPLEDNKKWEKSKNENEYKKSKTFNVISDQTSSNIVKNYSLKKSFSEELLVITDLNKANKIEKNSTNNTKPSDCSSCLTNQPYLKKMDIETDDDKLEILRERDFLKEMVSSLKFTVMKLLNFVGQQKKDLNTSLKYFDGEDTFYQSIQVVDPNQSFSDPSIVSNTTKHAIDLTTIIQEINDHSLLNSSNQVQEELDMCLDLVKKDAAGLLGLSSSENFKQFNELIEKIQSDKNELEKKLLKVEEIQTEMKEEMSATKEKLSQWERNLEVISESYGEEVAEPQKIISLLELKGKLKLFMTDKCAQPSQEMHILEEICKEGDRLQEEWKREKLDLQQQIEVADKQLNSLKKFLEEQASEREQEREAFDKEINILKDTLKVKEKENSLQTRTNQEDERLDDNLFFKQWMEILETQIKDLSNQISDLEKNKKGMESEFQNAVKKIWSLREVIQDLEIQLAETSERESSLKKKVEKLDLVIEEQGKVLAEMKKELDIGKNNNEVKYSEHIKILEEEIIGLRHSIEHFNPETLYRIKSNLKEIEEIIVKKTKNLEIMHMSSTNVSCSSPSEDVSIRDHLDATRCSTPDEMTSNEQFKNNLMLPLEEIDRLYEKLERHTRAEEVASKFICDLKMQLKNNKKTFEEFQTEREILLDRVDQYLKENSSLKARLEEQRCNATLLQKKLNADLESQINRLEIDVEKLNDLCHQKDNQLQNMKEILENTTKALEVREAEVLKRSKEENSLMSTLKTDLANALNEKEKLEENLERVKNKLKESLKMPALIDSMLEEKNAEIDRLEKEVVRLSSEKSILEISLKKYEEVKFFKNGKKIKFSEPESFGDCVSSISPYSPSILRNCNDSFGDFRNSSFKLRQQTQSFAKPESLCSIGPLQLSPRGTNSYSNWKTSSPICERDNLSKNITPIIPPKTDKSFEKMAEQLKLHQEVELKQKEILELKLEIDIMKRQLVEINQELQTVKSEKKEIQFEFDAKNEELQKIKYNEGRLMMTLDALKKSYGEEVEELQNKLRFEKAKVESISEEIKTMEMKKIEIEELFYSLKEDYNEKLKVEQNMVKTLTEKNKDLEWTNCEIKKRFESVKQELENVLKESKVFNKSENTVTNIKIDDLKNAEVQVDGDWCFNCRNEMIFKIPEIPTLSSQLKNGLDKLKIEFDDIISKFTEKEFSQRETVSYLISIKNILLLIFKEMNEIFEELNAYRKKVMESSVDELATKVKKELLLSAKLDNDLLSSIEAKGFSHTTSNSEQFDTQLFENENYSSLSFKQNISDIENLSKAIKAYKESIQKIKDLDNEKFKLKEKLEEQQKIIKFLEDNLLKEKDRIIKEKERCSEDAKIMELLRVNLEKNFQDLKKKEKEVKKERQCRLSLEKEITTLKKHLANIPSENKKIRDLNCELEAQKQKIISLNKNLENEQRKHQELKLQLEQNKIERKSEKETYKLLESDLNILKEQKETLKSELMGTKQLLSARDVEIGLLKRKINLQEIDIKALSLTSNFNRPSFSEVSSINSKGDILKVNSEKSLRENLENDFPGGADSNPLAFKMQQLSTCVQQHVQESNNMGEALLHLSEETERMIHMIKNLEDSSNINLEKENSERDANNMKKKLWDLEKDRLLMDLEILKSECELTKRESLETCKTNEILKLQNSQLKSEIEMLEKEATKEMTNEVLKDRITHLMGKYMRTESYRKALIWQKRYLTITLNGYQRSEEEAWKRLGKFGSKKKDGKPKKRSCGKFKAVVLAVVAIFRMKFIVKRWHSQKFSSLSSCLSGKAQILKNNPLASVLSIYNEPVNPLLYQTHNIVRGSSTVLRSPPSRDPGLKSHTLNVNKGSEWFKV